MIIIIFIMIRIIVIMIIVLQMFSIMTQIFKLPEVRVKGRTTPGREGDQIKVVQRRGPYVLALSKHLRQPHLVFNRC